MAENTRYIPGTFCWEDLHTSDTKAAKSFYQSLFGWKIENVKIGDEPTYCLFSIQGKEVCGISELTDLQQNKKIQPHWNTYIAVANTDEFVKIAKIAGATIIEGLKEHVNAGRSALVQDPTGAIFGIWESRKQAPGDLLEVPGTACWRELMTPNIDVAGKFYSTVCSWNAKPEKFGDMSYVTFKLGTKSVGGMMGTIHEGIPPHWLTYWTVKNCDKSVKASDSLGGKVLKSTTAIKGVGKFAVLSDPQGAVFAVLQPEMK